MYISILSDYPCLEVARLLWLVVGRVVVWWRAKVKRSPAYGVVCVDTHAPYAGGFSFLPFGPHRPWVERAVLLLLLLAAQCTAWCSSLDFSFFCLTPGTGAQTHRWVIRAPMPLFDFTFNRSSVLRKALTHRAHSTDVAGPALLERYSVW